MTSARRVLPLCLLSVAAAAGAMIATPGAASAAVDHGCNGPYDNRTYNDQLEVCFQPNGDTFWVHDKASDGRSAYAEWTNPRTGESGTCRNSMGAGTWGACGYDFRETDVIVYAGFTKDNEGNMNIIRDRLYGPRRECANGKAFDAC